MQYSLPRAPFFQHWTLCLAFACAQAMATGALAEGIVILPVKTGVSPPVTALPRAPESAPTDGDGPMDFLPIPVRPAVDPEARDAPSDPASPASTRPDPAIQSQTPTAAAPGYLIDFEGIGSADSPYVPPDSVGDVGPNHYVQMVNVAFSIWDKTGTVLVGATPINALFAGFGGVCETTNRGDPIVLYDQAADRWLLSQFAFNRTATGNPIGPYHQCIAISQTGNPTGAYYLYDFVTSQTLLNDYPKFGVWSNAYFLSVNQFDQQSGFSFAGAGVAAFERDKMLVGDPNARMWYIDTETLPGNPDLYSMLPADLDGAAAPPAGAPNPFVQFVDGAPDRLSIWNFDVDWSSNPPGGTGFTLAVDLSTAAFDSILCFDARGACIEQPDTSRTLEDLSDRLMFRLAYRNFGAYQAMVLNHTVDVNGNNGAAGIRWYELRDNGSGWGIQQQSTYSPDTDNRWMGSIAMDKQGNIALGYSVSSTSLFPSIRFTGRLATDPANSLQAEATLIAGSGSQTGSSRWGDYSAMSIDPADDCTFWYTQEYVQTTGSVPWQTRIGALRFPECFGDGPAADLSISKDNGLPSVKPGDPVTYVIQVGNAGPDDATGATVTDNFPPELTGVTWTCSASSGSSCTAAGTGAISDTVTLLTAGVLTYTVDAVVAASATGTLTNTASVSPPAGLLDPNPNNNSATDSDPIVPDQLDHFLCYKAKETKGSSRFDPDPYNPVALDDQFEDKLFDLKRRDRLCNPANQNSAGISDEQTHLLSYLIRETKGQPKHSRQTNLRVTNQFGNLWVDTLKPERLLVPAAKDEQAPPAGPPNPNDHDVDHYECYKVRQSAGLPKFQRRVLSLEDQFGQPALYDVRRPTRLCTPVIKNQEPGTDKEGNAPDVLSGQAQLGPAQVRQGAGDLRGGSVRRRPARRHQRG